MFVAIWRTLHVVGRPPGPKSGPKKGSKNDPLFGPPSERSWQGWTAIRVDLGPYGPKGGQKGTPKRAPFWGQFWDPLLRACRQGGPKKGPKVRSTVVGFEGSREGVLRTPKRGPKGVQKGVQKGVKNTATPGKGVQKGGHFRRQKGSVGGSKWPKGLKRTQKGGSKMGSFLGSKTPLLRHMAKWGSQVPSNRHVNRGSKRGPKRGSKRAYLGVHARLGHP